MYKTQKELAYHITYIVKKLANYSLNSDIKTKYFPETEDEPECFVVFNSDKSLEELNNPYDYSYISFEKNLEGKWGILIEVETSPQTYMQPADYDMLAMTDETYPDIYSAIEGFIDCLLKDLKNELLEELYRPSPTTT